MQNQSFSEIIKSAAKNFTCPLCGRHYENSEVKLRGFFDEVYIFQTYCARNHPPLVSIFIAALSPKTNIKTNPTPFIKPQQQKEPAKNPINDFYKQIDAFDGDFTKLWKE